MNNKELYEKVIKSYSENTGFIGYQAEELRKFYSFLGVDPKSTHRSIFDFESMSHHLQHELEKLIKQMNINSQDLLLDAGCGNGAPTRLIAKICGCRIVGIDINPKQIKRAEECNHFEGVDHLIELQVKDIHQLDFAPEYFDKIFHNETMVHWMDKKNALSKLYAVLKKDGVMGFHDWLRGDKGELDDAGGSFTGLYERGIWFQKDLSEIKKTLEEVGFEVIQCQDTTDIVDLGYRAKARELRISKDYYSKSGIEKYYKKSLNYCQAMVETHYKYLKYGRFLCVKK